MTIPFTVDRLAIAGTQITHSTQALRTTLVPVGMLVHSPSTGVAFLQVIYDELMMSTGALRLNSMTMLGEVLLQPAEPPPLSVSPGRHSLRQGNTGPNNAFGQELRLDLSVDAMLRESV